MIYLDLPRHSIVQADYGFPANYSYPVTLSRGHSGGRPGSRIIEAYTTGQRWTPEQKKRCIEITIFAVATIAAVALTIVASTLTMMSLLYVAIPLFAIGVGAGIWYLATKKYDLDSPHERAEARRELPPLPFDAIMHKHAIDRIVGYDLLEDISIGPDAKTQFYNAIACLAKAHHEVETIYYRDVATIDSIHSDGTAPIKRQRNEGESNIHYRNITCNMIASELCSPRNTRSTGGAILSGLAAGGSLLLAVDGHNRIGEINQNYGRAMAPWDLWRNRERNKIDPLFRAAITEIERQYRGILTQYQPVNG